MLRRKPNTRCKKTRRGDVAQTAHHKLDKNLVATFCESRTQNSTQGAIGFAGT
jgi:hypothetical protein